LYSVQIAFFACFAVIWRSATPQNAVDDNFIEMPKRRAQDCCNRATGSVRLQ
jgi:hypothetical protein